MLGSVFHPLDFLFFNDSERNQTKKPFFIVRGIFNEIFVYILRA